MLYSTINSLFNNLKTYFKINRVFRIHSIDFKKIDFIFPERICFPTDNYICQDSIFLQIYGRPFNFFKLEFISILRILNSQVK